MNLAKETNHNVGPIITVGLLWHSLSSSNLGVGALTESNIAIIRGVAESLGIRVNFIVLGTGSETLPELEKELRAAGHDLDNNKIRIYRKNFRNQIRRCNLVIDIGEGDSFSDIYGFKRFFYYWLSKNIVCMLGKPLILAPQTIGPFDGRFTRWLAKQIMRRCKSIFARDNLSSKYLTYLGINGNTHEAIDVAFKLPFTIRKFITNGKFQVGINVSGLLFNGGYTGENQFNLTIDYQKTIRNIITWFVSKADIQVHLIAHVISTNMLIEDDFLIANKLAIEFPSVIVAPYFNRPAEAKSYISGLDFFTGARMHACIAAFSSGVPVVPMAYSRKFNGLFDTLGYKWLADCKKNTSEEIEKIIYDGYINRHVLLLEIKDSLRLIEEKIARYEKEIKLNMKDIKFSADVNSLQQ